MSSNKSNSTPHDGGGSETANESTDASAGADNDTDSDSEEDPREKAYIAQVQQLIGGLMAMGRYDEVVNVMQQLFEYYRTREYITPDIDLRRFAARFVAAETDVEYCWSLSFDIGFFARLCYEGFLSICSYPAKLCFLLMPWIAPTRAVMDFGEMHVSKQLKKRSKGYHMTINADFEGVVKGCVQQHGKSWLWKPMQNLLKQGFCDPKRLLAQLGTRTDPPDEAVGRPLSPTSHAELKSAAFRVVTFELWNSATGELVAGDLGYVVGSFYTSMTGFRSPKSKSCGTIQLVATYALLKRCGFAFWDLGMVMDYKKALGAKVVSKREFIDRYHGVRDKECRLFIPPHTAQADLVGTAPKEAPASAKCPGGEQGKGAKQSAPKAVAVAESEQTAGAIVNDVQKKDATASVGGGGGGAAPERPKATSRTTRKPARNAPRKHVAVRVHRKRNNPDAPAIPAVPAVELIAEAFAMQKTKQPQQAKSKPVETGAAGASGADRASASSNAAKAEKAKK